jgi:hypothetical protein
MLFDCKQFSEMEFAVCPKLKKAHALAQKDLLRIRRVGG